VKWDDGSMPGGRRGRNLQTPFVAYEEANDYN